MKIKYLLIILILISNIAISQTKYPGFDIVGKGYDVFGEFANNKSIERYKIFDFSKIEVKKNEYGHTIPKLITIENISDHIINSVEGSSIKEYISNLSNKAGLSANAFFFKASINNQFDLKSTSTSNVFFYTYMDINTKWRINLDIRNIDTLINYLDNQFKIDIATLSPEKFFDRYGTHYIASAYLGGRIDYSSISELTSNITTQEIKTAINAKYKILSGNINNNNDNNSTLSQTKTNIKLNVVGGNSEFTNSINNREQYRKWAEGIRASPVLSGFDKKSLIPLWELTKDIRRKELLKDYYEISILPKYSIPTYFKKDKILDNENLKKKFTIYITGFSINKDCDKGTYLGGEESGDFMYGVYVYVNEKEINHIANNDLKHIWGGNFLKINKPISFYMPLKKGSSIKVWWKLQEVDQYTDDETVGEGYRKHLVPFNLDYLDVNANSLYNFKDKGNLYWSERLWHSNDCNATFYYQIIPEKYNNTALEFGNKGSEEFKNSNYDKTLYYSRKALEIDNSLWFVHYNVALVYLIKGNPFAYHKYQFITGICDNKKSIKGALQDILDYENKFGIIKNSESIKILLKSN